MSWHPSRASQQPLDPDAPSRYRSAVVQCCAGRSMLVRTEDGDERLVPAPATATESLVGSTVLLANDYDWVVAVEPAGPDEHVAVDIDGERRDVVIDLRAPGAVATRRRPGRLGTRFSRHTRRSWR